MAEETSKSFQVFGDSAQSLDFKGVQLSWQKIRHCGGAGFGSLFKVIGSSEEEAAHSQKPNEVAADIPFTNTVDEAPIALSAGLRGESEPLKRFAVFLNDATLKQEALRLAHKA